MASAHRGRRDRGGRRGRRLAERAGHRPADTTDHLTQGEQRREPAESALFAVAVDGKTVRGAIDSEGNQVHVLAAATHGEQLILGQVEVGATSNEIPMFALLLDGLIAAGGDLRGLVITADALHSQRAHAEYLHSIGAEFVLTVKGNQPRLFAALDALPWAQTPIAARDIDTSHGRVTTRTIQVLPAPAQLSFPHVNLAVVTRVSTVAATRLPDI